VQSPELSIVVVTWNAAPYVRRCVASLTEHTRVPFELIVVDNASQPETRSLLQQFERDGVLRLVQNEENVLWAPACNQGLAAISRASRHVLLLNPDCEILRPDWVDRMAAVLERDPTVAVTGTGLNWKRIGPVFGCVDGHCFFMRRAALDEIGLLDAERYPWNGAPYDWCARAFARNWIYRRCRNDPPFLVHHGHKSVDESADAHPWRRVDVEDMYRRAGLGPSRPHRLTLAVRRALGMRFFFDPDA
jgi:GT2 family glycosyltransferase